jgi:hypothetical protein
MNMRRSACSHCTSPISARLQTQMAIYYTPLPCAQNRITAYWFLILLVDCCVFVLSLFQLRSSSMHQWIVV